MATNNLCTTLSECAQSDYVVRNELCTRAHGHCPVIKGQLANLPTAVQKFIAEKVSVMTPRAIHVSDGSVGEAEDLQQLLVKRGVLEPLTKLDNCFACRTDPRDVARVETKTWLTTDDRFETECKGATQPSQLAKWMSPETLRSELDSRFPGCMLGRVLYVIPYCMGPIGSPFSKLGVLLTDSAYVVLCMRIMTRVTPALWNLITGEASFVKCIHSVGCPLPLRAPPVNNWLCNPDKVMIAHMCKQREIWSFGSGYGGNSLLGKKCFALRIASVIAREEGWIAAHMCIMGIKAEATGREHFVAVAFPSVCGKTNLCMMKPSLPGYTVRVIGDDIAWLRFDAEGQLRAINPENGFFGVASDTSHRTNPNIMDTFDRNSLFTNVATTDTGNYFWEGLENELDKNTEIVTWRNEKRKVGDRSPQAAHANSRYATPCAQSPVLHPRWEDPKGVEIEAILFGGRRPEGVPLIYETFDWGHGVFVAASLKSSATAAAEHQGQQLMHDPMAMRAFMAYNFGTYLKHWLGMQKDNRKMPRVFNVNLYRRDGNNNLMWPGFGENIRVLQWVVDRLEGKDNTALDTPIGYVPKQGSLNVEGLEPGIKWDELFSTPADYWKYDMKETTDWLQGQLGEDMPPEMKLQIDKQQARIDNLK